MIMLNNSNVSPSERQNVSPASARPLDVVDAIIALESGDLGEDAIIGLFQNLIDSGLAWQLQGTYGRTARTLIDAGLCSPA